MSVLIPAQYPLKWDGSPIGEISSLIVQMSDYDGRTMVVFSDGSKAFITQYLGTIVLIGDELKQVFGMEKVGRSVCTYQGITLMLHRYNSQEYNLENVDFSIPIRDIQKVLVFRWFLGLTNNNERSILIRRFRSGMVRVTSKIETKYDYISTKSTVSKNMVSKWFHNDFKSVAQSLIRDRTFYQIRLEIEAIVKRIDPSHNFWIISILSRVGQFMD
jgi:hypothetical protein